MTRRISKLITPFLSLVACGRITAQEHEVTYYRLVTVDGSVLPAEITAESNCRRWISFGALTIAEDSAEFRLRYRSMLQCPGMGGSDEVDLVGRVEWRDGTRYLVAKEEPTYEGIVRGDTVWIRGVPLELRFQRVDDDPEEDPDEFASFLQEEWNRTMVAALDSLAPAAVENAYRCEDDLLLRRAPAIPSADTAGLGALIKQHFGNDWNVSTEREIACRFPLSDGSKPSMYWPKWGSGTAWWIWRADFDGDRREDRMVLLTSRFHPAEDLLVVLFANGDATEIRSPGGWGVGIVPRGTVIRDIERGSPVRLSTDALMLLYWEKASEVAYWDAAARRFRWVTTSD